METGNPALPGSVLWALNGWAAAGVRVFPPPQHKQSPQARSAGRHQLPALVTHVTHLVVGVRSEPWAR